MPDGGHGSAQERFAAYGRTGEPCPRCGTPIRRLVVGQRGVSVGWQEHDLLAQRTPSNSIGPAELSQHIVQRALR